MKKILILSSVAIQCLLSGCNSYTYNTQEAEINNLHKAQSYQDIKDVTTSVFNEKIDNNEFKLENIEYSFPTVIKELKNNGWSLQDNSIRILKGGEKITSMLLKNNDKEMVISIENDSKGSEIIDNCKVSGILIQDIEKQCVDIKILNDISIGTTKEEVEKIMSKYDVEIREDDEIINYIINENRYLIGVMINKSTQSVFSILLSELK